MRYDLPAHPPAAVAGPDDVRWWAHPAVEAAGWHAVVIGEPTTPDQAVDDARPLDDVGAWPPNLHAAPNGGVGQKLDDAARLRGGLPDQAAPGQPATGPRTAGLVTLPHTGLREPDLRVTALRPVPTRNGVAFTAQVALANTIVGTMENDGNGGQTSYRAVNSSPFNARTMAEYARACRVSGRTPSDELVLDLLVAEYDNATHVAQATRAGRSPLRLVAPVVDVGDDDDAYTTVGLTTAPTATTTGQRDALVADLLRQTPQYDGQRWQLWTGQRWEDLPPTSTHESPAGAR
jgi:hypothetical protein